MNPTKHEIQLQRVFNEHLPALKSYAESYQHNGQTIRGEDVNDVMSEVLRRFFKQSEKGLIDNPRGLLVTLTKRELIRFFSAVVNSQDALGAFGYTPFDTDEDLTEDQHENAHTQDPLDLMIQAENRESVRSLAETELKTLVPNDDHRLIYLLAVDDMPYATIAEKFEMPVRTVEDIVHKVRTRMKGYLGGQ